MIAKFLKYTLLLTNYFLTFYPHTPFQCLKLNLKQIKESVGLIQGQLTVGLSADTGTARPIPNFSVTGNVVARLKL